MLHWHRKCLHGNCGSPSPPVLPLSLRPQPAVQRFRVAGLRFLEKKKENARKQLSNRGYGATAARLTPDQKVGSSNLSALKPFGVPASLPQASVAGLS